MAKVRRFMRKHGSSIKTTGANAAGGVAVAFLDRQFLSSESGQNMLGKDSYVKPIVVIVAAHFLKGKAPNLAAGMAGAGGYMLAQTYFEKSDGSKNENAEGVVDVGALRTRPGYAFGPGGMNSYDDADAVFEFAQQ